MTYTEPPKFTRTLIEKEWNALPVGGKLVYWHDKLDFGQQTEFARKAFMAMARTWAARLHVKNVGGRVIHFAVKLSDQARAA